VVAVTSIAGIIREELKNGISSSSFLGSDRG
jgi:hypothetical protein